jgi:hypothetical protein
VFRREQLLLSLQTLSLVNTGLTGQLPVLWGVNGSFPSLVILDASRNILSGKAACCAVAAL